MVGLVLATMIATGGAADSVAEAAQAAAAYAAAGDARDVARLEALLDPAFRVVIGGAAAPKVMTRDDYLAGMRAGKLGGAKRDVVVHGVERRGPFATVRATLTRADATFETTLLLVRVGEAWRLLEDVVVMTPRAG